MEILNGREFDGCSRPLIITDNQDIAPMQEIRSVQHVTVVMAGFARHSTSKDVREALSLNNIVEIYSTDIKFKNYAYGISFVTLLDDMNARKLISLSPILIQGNRVYITPLQVPKPKDTHILNFINQLQQNNDNYGLTVLDIQWELFKFFSYRFTLPAIKKMVKRNRSNIYMMPRVSNKNEVVHSILKSLTIYKMTK